MSFLTTCLDSVRTNGYEKYGIRNFLVGRPEKIRRRGWGIRRSIKKGSMDRFSMLFKTFALIALLEPGASSFAQKVFSVKYQNQADVTVFVVGYENQADLKVYKEKYPNQAGDNNGRWFFTDYANQAAKKIWFADYENQAELTVFFVEYENQAGWRNKEKMYLMY